MTALAMKSSRASDRPSSAGACPTIKRATDSLRRESWGDRVFDQGFCPGCGDEYVHFELGHVEKTDDYTCPLGTRGSWLALNFYCENCSSTWRLIVGEHKGHTFIGNEVRRP
jgi:hypothetical protein